MKGNNGSNIKIFNILRQIGLSPKLKGTKLLLSAIVIALTLTDDIINLSYIYSQLSIKYNISYHSIESAISYSLHNLIGYDYERNFEKIFGIEYCIDFYTGQSIIEEVTRIIKLYNY